VGHFLQGAAVLTRWYCKGTPQALAELRQVYEYMDGAEAILYRSRSQFTPGYMDLARGQSAFSNPEQAIERLENLLALGI